jgi:uncharacterized protein (TIGR03067 family)
MTTNKPNLNGTWRTVHQEFEGREVPQVEFKGHELILQDSTYIMIGARMDEGIILVDGQKLYIYGTDGANNGRHYSAIYKLEENRLTICYNLAGQKHPSDFRTAGKIKHFL